MKVFVVEHEPGIRRLMRDQLQDRGVEVTVAASVGAAQQCLERGSFDVVILDLALPDGSGLEVLDGLRRSGSRAHVVVMSPSTAEADRVRALQGGADDYVVKPIFLRELTARVLAVRRPGDPDKDARLQVGPLTIDLRARQVRSDDRILDLTAKEFDLLAYLAARPGHVFSRGELLEAVWQSTPEWQQAATVTEHISRLRAKIEDDPQRPGILRTVRSAGYRLDLPGDGPAAADKGAEASDRGAELAPGTLVQTDGRIVHADRAAVTLLGYADEADLVGRPIVDLVAPGSKEIILERMAVTGSSQEHRSGLVDLERADGSEVSVEVTSGITVWHGQQAALIRLTNAPDPSSRLRRLVAGVLSEMTDAVIIGDLHFHLRSWNKAAERMYGWREEEVLGRHILDVLPWLDDDEALTAVWESLETKGRWDGRCRQTTRDGSVISVLEYSTLVRDDSGVPVLVVSVNRPAPRSITSPSGRRLPRAAVASRVIPADTADLYWRDAFAGRGKEASRVALALLDDGVSSDDIVNDLLASAQRAVGERWLHNECTVADEHLVSGATQKALDAVALSIDPTATDGLVVVACAEGDWHSLPAQMLAELLRAHGFEVVFLGASTPSAHVSSLLDRRPPDALAVSCTLPMFFTGVTRLADVAHRHGVPVIAGGRALGDGPDRALRLGADGWASRIDGALTVLRDWQRNPPTLATDPIRLDPRALQLERRAPEVGAAAFVTLAAAYPAMGAYNADQLARTSEDLVYITRFIAAGRLVDDPTVVSEFFAWLVILLAARGIPAGAVTAGLRALAPLIEEVDPEAAPLVAASIEATLADGEEQAERSG